MRIILRSLAVACVLASALGVARADTYAGTASFSDTSGSNNDFNFTGSFDTPSFSFAANSSYVYTDNLNLTINNVNCIGRGCNNASDALSVAVNFTLPSSGGTTFSGSGGEYGYEFFGFVTTGGWIDWTNNSQTVNFSDGSKATIDLADVNLDTVIWPDNTLTDCMTITVDPSSPAPTPEPSSLVLLGTGILGMAGIARRKFAL